MNNNNNNINNISNITKLPINYLNLFTKSNNKLNISFDNNSSQIINSFFSQINNVNIKNLYLKSNDYSFELDLLETNLSNNFEIYLWIVDCVKSANQIINSKSNKYAKLFDTGKNIWKISICKDIMFNYPFTLDDVIFLPISYIVSEYNLSKNNLIKSKKIINTIIHEKIHISQRKNELLWESFIKLENCRWKKILSDSKEFKIINSNTNNNIIISNIEYSFILNPDTTYNNFKYIWIGDNGNKYYGQYICNIKTKQIIKNFFKIDLKENKLIPVDLDSNSDLDEEHPYETFAYKIADELVNNNL